MASARNTQAGQGGYSQSVQAGQPYGQSSQAGQSYNQNAQAGQPYSPSAQAEQPQYSPQHQAGYMQQPQMFQGYRDKPSLNTLWHNHKGITRTSLNNLIISTNSRSHSHTLKLLRHCLSLPVATTLSPCPQAILIRCHRWEVIRVKVLQWDPDLRSWCHHHKILGNQECQFNILILQSQDMRCHHKIKCLRVNKARCLRNIQVLLHPARWAITITTTILTIHTRNE